MARTNLNFHLTFRPERQYLSSLLLELPSCNNEDVQGISNLTGIPTGKSSGKVEPMLCYAEYMGLMEKEKRAGAYCLNYTPVGKVIAQEDGGLLEKLSLLWMHCMLVRPYSGAELWAHIIHNVFPKYRNELTEKQFDKEVEIEFGPNTKTAPFKGSYQDLFAVLNLINFENDRVVMQPSKIDTDFVYLYGLVLYTYWDEWLIGAAPEETKLASKSEITSEHLKNMGFRKPFGWSEQEEYQVLELLAGRKVISLNRQMSPFTIRRTEDEGELTELLYSELC